MVTRTNSTIAKLLKQQPSLKTKLSEIISEAYGEAKEWASEETGLKIQLFPQNCPYLASDLLDKTWFPDVCLNSRKDKDAGFEETSKR